MKDCRRVILGIAGLLFLVPTSHAQDREVTGAIRFYRDYDGGMICRVPAIYANTVQQIIGTNLSGTNAKMLGALADLVTKEDDIECFTTDAQEDTYVFRLSLKADTPLVVTFLRGNDRHPAFYEVDQPPAKSDPDRPDFIVEPPHD